MVSYCSVTNTLHCLGQLLCTRLSRTAGICTASDRSVWLDIDGPVLTPAMLKVVWAEKEKAQGHIFSLA